MKEFLSSAIAGLTVLFGYQASAELIIYKGTARVNYIGENHAWSINFKLFTIIDHDTADFRQISYAEANGLKYYFTSHITNLHFVTVDAPKARSITFISKPPSQCAISEGARNDSVFFQGANSTITISENTTLSFPRSLSAPIGGFHFSDQSGQPIARNGNITSSFDKRNTLASNAAGENLLDALVRLRSFVESQGYSLAPGETTDAEVSAIDAFRSAAKPETEAVR